MSSEAAPVDGVTVRPETTLDIDAIRAVNDAAFGRPDEGRIVDRIRGTPDWIDGGSLVAEVASRVVGHLLLSKGQLTPTTGDRTLEIWMVGPVAVLPEIQRRGVGRRLLHSAIEFATSQGQPVLCLLGHDTYYPRFGFEPARRLGIEPPQPWPDASWLALRLPAWTPGLVGTASYAPPFGA